MASMSARAVIDKFKLPFFREQLEKHNFEFKINNAHLDLPLPVDAMFLEVPVETILDIVLVNELFQIAHDNSIVSLN